MEGVRVKPHKSSKISIPIFAVHRDGQLIIWRNLNLPINWHGIANRHY